MNKLFQTISIIIFIMSMIILYQHDESTTVIAEIYDYHTWNLTSGGDHCGEDWVPENNSQISGYHYNISTFMIPEYHIVRILPFSNGGGGLTISSKRTLILGHLNGSESGHQGGIGGLGYPADMNKNGAGGRGGSSGGGDGGNGKAPPPVYPSYPCGGGGGGGGGGGYGGKGSKGGDGTENNHGVGGKGGDKRGDINGYSIDMGSGGGGGGGGGATWVSSSPIPGDGVEGGNGGGSVSLISNSIVVDGSITCDGGKGGDGGFGVFQYAGGSSYFGGAGGGGGGGSGGGVLMIGDTIGINGTISASGGSGGNGGAGGDGGEYGRGEDGKNGGMGGGGRLKLFYHKIFNMSNAKYIVKGFEDGTIFYQHNNLFPKIEYMVHPKNNTWTDANPTMKWIGNDTDGDDLQYRIQVKVSGSDWSSSIVDQTISMNVYKISNPLFDGWTYEWRVIPFDGYEWGDWSDVLNFHVDSDNPMMSIPYTNSPFTNSDIIEWSWDPSIDTGSGIFGYLIDIGTSYANNDIIENCFTTEPYYELDNVIHGLTYYIRLRSINGATTKSDWSYGDFGVLVDRESPHVIFSNIDPTMTNTHSYSWKWDDSYDNLSGIDHYNIKIWSNSKKSFIFLGQTHYTEYNFSIPEEGCYQISVQAVDKSGNSGEYQKGHSICVNWTSPELLYIFPNDLQTLTYPIQYIKLRFSKPIDISSVSTESLFIINEQQKRMESLIEYSIDHKTIYLLIIDTVLLPGNYSIFISEDIEDCFGNKMPSSIYKYFSVKDGPIDYEIIEIIKTEYKNLTIYKNITEYSNGIDWFIGVYPNNNTNDIPIDTSIIIFINHIIDIDNTEDFITIIDHNARYVEFDYYYSDHGRYIQIFPKNKFEPDMDYTIQIDGSLRDIFNNSLNRTITSTFKTVKYSEVDLKNNDGSEFGMKLIYKIIIIVIVIIINLIILSYIIIKNRKKDHVETGKVVESTNKVFTQCPKIGFDKKKNNEDMVKQDSFNQKIKGRNTDNLQRISMVSPPKTIGKCTICMGMIKSGSPIIQCDGCQSVYHSYCAKRISECPRCGKDV